MIGRQLAPLLLMIGTGLTGPLAMAQMGQRNRVELQVVSDAADGIDQNQRWLEVLSQVGADNVRIIQSGRGVSRPGVENVTGASGTTYRITGILVDNRLILPAGRFGIRDSTGISDYITSVRADGADVALARKMAFGLTARQLVNLHDDLSRPLADSTIGQSPGQVLAIVQRSITTPIVVDPGARTALVSDYTLVDELQGISHGTALAAALRPLGLVLAPTREQGQPTEIRIVDSMAAEEFWPIGWPLQQRISQAAPKMYERIPVNIRNFTLAAALPAIQKKLEMPFLMDHNSLALQGVDLDKIRVNLESEQLSYQLILNRIISQARPRMELEVRADEAGQPFVWFSAR